MGNILPTNNVKFSIHFDNPKIVVSNPENNKNFSRYSKNIILKIISL